MKKVLKKYKNQFIVAILTFLLLEIIFIGSGIKPFKVDNILFSDLYYEYIPFFNYFRDAIINGRSILNSFSFTLGQSTVGILSYYALSPLNILLLFSNSYNIAYFIKALIIIKIVLSGLTMSVYLKNKVSNKKVVIFSLIYALTSYNILYCFNLMWLDVIYMLPLVILGLENLINGKSAKLYLISLSIMIFVNFYLAFGSCIFVFIYFFYYSLVNKKLNFKLFLKFILISLIAALLNAFMLFPTAYNMLMGKFNETSNAYSSFILYNPKAVIYNFIPSVHLGSFLIDLPYFYVSTLVLVLFLIYMFSKNVKINEKALALIVVMFLIFSTLIAPLDLLMHCFRIPSSFNFRYIYNLSFFLIAVVSKEKYDFNYLILIPIVLIILWASTLYINYQIIIFALLLIVYFMLIKYNKVKIIFLILIIELAYNGISVNIKIPANLDYDKVNSYKEIIKDYLPKDNEFYRIELSEPLTNNDSFILGTYGISSFSPTSATTSYIFLKNYLKMPVNKSYFFTYRKHSILDSYFLGIRYEIDNGKIFENKNYLPLIFKTNSIDSFEPSYSELENSNKLYHMINGEYFFNEVDFKIDCVNNKQIIKKECNITFNRNRDYKYYLEIFAPLNLSEIITSMKYSDQYYVSLIDNDFKLEFLNDTGYIESIKIYAFKEENIKNQNLDFEVFNDSYMKFNVENGYYMTTILYDDSWHIKNNGKEISKIKVLDSLIAFKAEEGVIELEFIPKLLNVGILISSITFLIVFIYYERKK